MKLAAARCMWDAIHDDVGHASRFNVEHVISTPAPHLCHAALVRAGMPLHKAGAWIGHPNVKISLERYLKQNAGDLFEGLDAIIAPKPRPELAA
ncbi:MAG: hypothetical protein JF570_02195 [Caulobacter sp.]|nr:hypothetical protein [Caulobacter sp.]